MLCPFSQSHPTGVRGLKSEDMSLKELMEQVAPHWGAWIEIDKAKEEQKWETSHPTGVRGLKYMTGGL